MAHAASEDEPTPFVRDVLMPGGPGHVPRIAPAACRFRLRIAASGVHRWGVFAAEDIPVRRRVIEYTGQRIGLREAWRRRPGPRAGLIVDADQPAGAVRFEEL